MGKVSMALRSYGSEPPPGGEPQVEVVGGLPRQNNNSDCGCHVLCFARALTEKEKGPENDHFGDGTEDSPIKWKELCCAFVAAVQRKWLAELIRKEARTQATANARA